MAKYESVLKFESYAIDEIVFKRNSNFNPENKPDKVEFGIKKSKSIEGNKMIIKLYTCVFENSEENNYPFEMSVCLTGYFEFADETGKYDFEPNAIAILYPYIRSIVSTYSVNANVGVVLLPTINVNEMLKNQNNEDKKD